MQLKTILLISLLRGSYTVAADASGNGIMQALEPLIQVGAVGAILAFFLVKLEPRLRGLEVAIYTMIRSNMLLVMASESPQVSSAMKKSAGEILEETKGRVPPQ